MPLSSTILTLLPETLTESSILSVLMSYCVVVQENGTILYLGSDYSVDSSEAKPEEPQDIIAKSANVMFFTCNNPRPQTPASLVAKRPYPFNKTSAAMLNDEVRYWNIVNPENPALLESNDDSGAATMIMPKIEGDTLDKWFNRPEEDRQIQMLIFYVIAAKLEQLHHKGLCHDDIHPGNIIVDYINGVLTVTFIDLGSCKPATTFGINGDIRALCITAYEKLITDSKSDLFKIIEEVCLENVQHSLAHIVEISESNLNEADSSPSP